MDELIKNKTTELIQMIHQLVSIIQYENQYAYRLLQQITCNKKTAIELDGCKVYLEATCNDEDYYLIARFPDSEEVTTQFISTSYTLRKIMAGIITIDHAIIKNEIYVQGSFEDIIGMYRLTACFLSEGPLNFRLRDLWHYFNETWDNNKFPLAVKPLENQKPKHGFLLDHIPENVLLIRV